MMRKNNKGISLVEILTVVALLGIVMAIAFSFFFNAWMNYSTEIARLSLAREADYIFMIMEEDVLEGNELNLVSGMLKISYPDPLRRDPDDASSAVIFGPEPRGNFPNQWVRYRVVASNFELRRITDTGKVTFFAAGMVDPSTNFVLEDDASFTEGAQVTVNLVLFENVFRKKVVYKQSKDIIIRNYR